jgi:hypothetical protein
MTVFTGVPATCGHLFDPTEPFFSTVFTGNVIKCAQCAAPIDVWTSVEDCFVGAGANFSLLAPLRGATAISSVTLVAGETYQVDLAALGVDKTATVRGVNFTGQGSSGDDGFIVPARLMGNEFRVPQLPHEFSIFPVPVGKNPPKSAQFSVLVQYIERPQEVHRRILLEAVYAHGDNDFRRAIIDAHTATDTALDSVLSARLNPLGPGEMRLGFIEKVKVASALGVAIGLKPFPTRIVDALGALNTQRNRVAHPPKKNAQAPTQKKTASMLTAALCVIEMVDSAGIF